jgi:DNA-binding response OmpR family regulator
MTHIEPLEAFDQRLVLAHPDVAFGVRAKRCLRRLGWKVALAKSGAGARCLTRELAPAVVVLSTELPDESGWLVCKKLTCEQSNVKVFLIGDRPSAEQARLAAFVGAEKLLRQQDALPSLFKTLGGTALAAGC